MCKVFDRISYLCIIDSILHEHLGKPRLCEDIGLLGAYIFVVVALCFSNVFNNLDFVPKPHSNNQPSLDQINIRICTKPFTMLKCKTTLTHVFLGQDCDCIIMVSLPLLIEHFTLLKKNAGLCKLQIITIIIVIIIIIIINIIIIIIIIIVIVIVIIITIILAIHCENQGSDINHSPVLYGK